MSLEYQSKTEFKGKHSQKLPEEPIHAVSLLLILTDLCDVIIQRFFSEYLFCNNYLLKSKISKQSIKKYGTYSHLIFQLIEDCRKQIILWIDLKFWNLLGNCDIINILQKTEDLHNKGW